MALTDSERKKSRQAGLVALNSSPTITDNTLRQQSRQAGLQALNASNPANAVTGKLSQYYNSLNDYFSVANTGLGRMGYSNAQSSYDNFISQTAKMREQNSEIKNYLEANKGIFTEESYADVLASLGELEPTLSELETAYKDAYDFHTGWGSEAGDKAGTKAYTMLGDIISSGGSYEDWANELQKNSQNAEASRADARNAYEKAMSYQGGSWDMEGNYLGDSPLISAEEKARLKDVWQQAETAAAWAAELAKMGKNSRYSDYSQREDFTQGAAAGLAAFESEADRLNTEQEAAKQAEYESYMALGTGGMAYEQSQVQSLRDDTTWREPREDWTQEERDIFGYIYNRDKEEAYAYAENLNNNKNAQKAYTQQQKAEDWATKNFGTGALATGASVIGQAFAGGDYLDNLVEYAARGTVTQKANLTAADYGNIMTGAIAESLNGKDSGLNRMLAKLEPVFGEIGAGDLYSVGYSVLQNMVYTYSTAGVGSLPIYFGIGAKSGYEDAILRGATPAKALTAGFASGLIETATEKFSVEGLLKLKSTAGLKGFLKNVAKQAFTEASEETMNQLITPLAEALILGDKSALNTATREYMLQGMSQEEAQRAAYIDWAKETAWSAMSGALSGSISGSLSSGAQMISPYKGDANSLIQAGLETGEGEAFDLAQEYKNYIESGRDPSVIGKAVRNAGRGLRNAMTPSAAFEQGNNVSRQVQEQSAQETKPGNIRGAEAARLNAALEDHYRGKNLEMDEYTAKSMLGDQGVTENLDELARIVAKRADGGRLTRAEQDMLKESPIAQRMAESLGANALEGRKAAAKALDTHHKNPGYEYYQQRLIAAERDLAPEWRLYTNSLTKQSEAKPAVQEETVKAAPAVQKSAPAYTVPAEAEVSGVVEDVLSKGRINNTTANAILDDPALKARFKEATGAKLTGTREQMRAEMRQIVSERGQAAADSEALARQAAEEWEADIAAEEQARAEENTLREGGYGSYIRGVLMNKPTEDMARDVARNPEARAMWEQMAKKTLPENEKSAVKMIMETRRKNPEMPERIATTPAESRNDKAAEAKPVQETKLQESKPSQREEAKESKKPAVPTKKGKGKLHYNGDRLPLSNRQRESLRILERLADVLGIDIYIEIGIKANGWYDPKDGSIHIDIDAGNRYEGTILFTAAHELTHFIRQWSPEKFNTLRDFLVENYGEQTLSELIEGQIAKAARNKRTMDEIAAEEEVVADAMQKMLLDGSVMEKLEALRQKDEGLAKQIISKLREFFKRIQRFYDGFEPGDRESALVDKMGEDAINRLRELFGEGLADASAQYRSAQDVGVDVDNATESAAPAILMSERTWTESDYVQESEKAAEEIAKAIGVTTQKAKDYIDSVNSIAKMIAEDRTRLDYFSSPGRSSFVGNVEYGGSFDFSTLCKKRRLLTGTFTAIQKALPNTALTANEILDIRNRMKKAGLEVSCGLCYVEGSRANMGQFAKEFLRLYKQYYPDAWQPNMADVNTPEGIEWVRINHPECYEQYEYFWNHYGTLKPGDKNLFASQQKPKLYQLHTEYKGEILSKFRNDDNVEEKNLNGGIRLQSFSDFEIVHLIDTMQIIMDMSRVGLAGQAYTKVPDFAWALGDTGLKINLSLIAKGVDADGKLIFDDVEGMPIKDAMALRERYSKNVGTILVAFNDEQLRAAMADERVDFIIPFHRSQWKKSQYEAMGLPAKTKDYTYMQNEKYIKPQYHEYRGRMVSDKATNYMPNEYWDFSKSGKENAEAYLEMCARNNKRPKFYKLLQNNGDGSYSLKADGSTDGYWKLLIDFKMYDNNGVGSPQTAVRPEFNMDEARRMLNDYRGGHSNFPVAQGIVDEFVSEYKEKHIGEIVSQMRKAIGKIMALDSVYSIDATNAASFTGDHKTDERIGKDVFKKQGSAAYRKGLGNVVLGSKGVVNTVFHGNGPAKQAAFPAIKQVIEHGIEVGHDYNHKGRGYDTITLAAPIDFFGDKAALAAVVKIYDNGKGNKSFYLHEICDAEGNYIELVDGRPQKKENSDISLVDSSSTANITVNGETPKANVPQDSPDVKRPGRNNGAVMTEERIDYLIEDSGAGNRTDYAQKWITSINPTDFLNMTLGKENQDRAKFDTMPGDYDTTVNDYDFIEGGLKKSRQTPYLAVDIDTGEVVGHEGRHRMRALEKNGVTYAEIAIEFRDSDGRIVKELNGYGNPLEVIDSLTIYNQRGTGQSAVISNIIPLNKANRDTVLTQYGATKDGDIQFSLRDTPDTSSRALLAEAFEGVAQSESEVKRVQEYRRKIEGMNAEEQKLKDIRAEIKELSFATGKRDTARIKELRDEVQKSANRLAIYDRQLLRLEASQPLQALLKREKDMTKVRDKAKYKAALDDFKRRTKAATLAREKAFAAEKRAAVQEVRSAEEQKRLELLRKMSESRKKLAADRAKTAARHRIIKKAETLSKLLNKGTKERNVKEGMKSMVISSLDFANALFSESYSVEDMIVNGFKASVSSRYEQDIMEARRIIEALKNVQKGSAEEQKLRGQLEYRKGKLRDLVFDERELMYEAEIADVLNGLVDEYKAMQKSEYDYIRSAYSQEAAEYLEAMSESMSKRKARDMTLAELEQVNDAFRLVIHAVRNANKSFAEGKDISVEGGKTNAEILALGKDRERISVARENAERFGWNNLKPIYAMKLIGSETLLKYFERVRGGEDTWARDYGEAMGFFRTQAERFGYNKWDKNKRYKFTSSSDLEFELTLEQMMSLYAYSKREAALGHLKVGGFVFDSSEVFKKKGVEFKANDAKTYNLSEDILSEITNKLTQAQRDFVDVMQDYLSDTMGSKGNEVSMKMYGVKLFNEKNYFPLRVASQYMERAREAQPGERKLKNGGFTKPLKPEAGNPVVLTSFMDTWAGHVNDMSMYHAFVLPLEDFYRVYNYQTRASEDSSIEAVIPAIQNAYGKAATDYIDQMLKDLNGGALVDPRATLTGKMISKFKKASTFTSMSVVIQQPSAIGRAFAYINPKYFSGQRMDNKAHKSRWEEIKKYAPVALIKEMGYFDTNMGRSAKDYMLAKQYKSLGEKVKGFVTDSQYRDDVLSRLPALMDELTWCAIWEAAKRETAATTNLKRGSQEFMEAVSKRFTEVIVNTQVYDSVLSRSANMRSKDTGMTMLTSFMAEPTTTMNMVVDGIVQGKRGNKAMARKAIGAALTSVILNAALVSIVYAARDDDEDESFLEKYLASLSTEIVDGINPLTYFPVIRDVWSLLQGYDVERADMSLLADLIDAANGTVKILAQDTSDMSEEEQQEWLGKLSEALWKDTDYITAMFGLSIKNVRRDIKAVFNTIDVLAADYESTPQSVIDAIKDSLTSSLPIIGQLPKEKKQDKLYEAMTTGDSVYAQRIIGSYSDETAAHTAIRKGLRDNDSRIREAALARLEGDNDEYIRIAQEIIGEGVFDRDDIIKAIQSEMNSMKDKESSSGGTSPDMVSAADYYNSIMAGDLEAADAVWQMFVQQYKEKGKLESDAATSLAGGFTSNIREDFMEDEIGREDAEKYLMQYGGKEEEDAELYLDKLEFQKEYGYSWDEREEAFRLGEITEEELVEEFIEVKNITREAALEEVEVIKWQNMGLSYATVANIQAYKQWCERSNVPKDIYLEIREIANNTENDKDENGRSINYSAMKKIMAVINSYNLTPEQKTAIAQSLGWASKNINKYKLW